MNRFGNIVNMTVENHDFITSPHIYVYIYPNGLQDEFDHETEDSRSDDSR